LFSVINRALPAADAGAAPEIRGSSISLLGKAEDLVVRVRRPPIAYRLLQLFAWRFSFALSNASLFGRVRLSRGRQPAAR
jgi:hypothetical protein